MALVDMLDEYAAELGLKGSAYFDLRGELLAYFSLATNDMREGCARVVESYLDDYPEETILLKRIAREIRDLVLT